MLVILRQTRSKCFDFMSCSVRCVTILYHPRCHMACNVHAEWRSFGKAMLVVSQVLHELYWHPGTG